MPSITKHLFVTALALALGVGLAAAPAMAEDATPSEVVRKCVPDLNSKDPGKREDARREILALGDEGRDALRLVSQGDDPTAAAAALALLDDARWKAAKAEKPAGTDIDARMERLRKLLEGKDFEKWHREVVANLPERIEVDLKRLFGEGQISAGTLGRIEQDGRLLAWKQDAKGGISVTVRDGRGAAEKTYEAASLEELREKAPEVAKRLDAVQAEHAKGGFTLIVRPHVPSVELGPGLRDVDVAERHVREALERMRVDFADARSLLQRVRAFAPRKPLLGIEWTRPTPALREQLGIESGGMLVGRVTAGTPAGRLGLRRHDVLVELAGRKVAGNADIRAALDSVEEGATLTAVVIRKAKRVQLSAKR